MSNYRFYTKEEDRVILSNARKYPQNLQLSFRESAKVIDRDAVSICSRYYYLVRKQKSTCFLTVSEKRAFKNRKIVREGYEKEHELINHKGILAILFNKIKDLF